MIRSRIIRKLLRIFIWLIGIFLGICLLLLLSFSIYRGKIYSRILATVNENRPGELQVENVKIAPFAYYPFLAIKLDSVIFYEKKEEFREVGASPVLEITTVYLGFKYPRLLKKDFRIGGISLEGGYLNLKVNADSTLNILRGLGTYERSYSTEAGEDSEKKDSFGALDLIEFIDLSVSQTNEITGDSWQLKLSELTNYYYEVGDTVKSNLEGNLEIVNVKYDQNSLISHKPFGIKLDYVWDLISLEGSIDTGIITLGQVDMNISGTFSAGIPAEYDLHFFIDREGLDTLSLQDPNSLLTNEGTGNGRIHVDGNIEGTSIDRHPDVEVEFLFENLSIDDPMGDSTAHGFNLSGSFFTGDSSDLSQAELVIHQMDLMVGQDTHRGSLSIRNFKTPWVSLDLDSRIEMRDLDKYFHFNFITDMNGFIEVSADVNGLLDLDNNRILEEGGSIDIHFDDFSFLIPGTGQFYKEVNGHLEMKEEQIVLKDISLKTGQSDLFFDGSASNLIYLFSKTELPIECRLDIRSGQLALKELLASDTSIFLGENDLIKNLALNLELSTTNRELRTSNFIPGGIIKINSLSAKLPYLSDPLKCSGVFSVSDNKPGTGTVKGELERYNLSIDDMNIQSGGNDLRISGFMESIIDLQSPGSSPVFGKLSLKSDHLALSSVFAFDTILASKYNEELSDASLELRYNTSLENISSQWYLPRGEVTLNHFSAKLKTRQDIIDASGAMIVTDNRISFDDLQGVYGKSDLSFSLYIDNYPGLWITDSIIEIDIGFSARSDLMRADDFFTYQNISYLLSKYKGEYLEDFALAVKFHYINQDFFEVESLPDASIEITELQWITSFNKLHFRDFHIKLKREGNDLDLVDFKGKIGKSDFVLSAYLKNFTPFSDPGLSNFSAELNVKASNLDLNELTGIQFPKPEQPKFNPFKFIYHDLSLELDIDKLSYNDYLIRHIKGKLNTERSQKIHLDNLTMETGGGELKLNADLDTENPEDVVMRSKVLAKNIHFDRILLNFQLRDQEVSPGDYFKGILNLEAETEVHMDPDLKIDMAHTSGNLDFSLADGQILNFPPMQELGKYFGDKDLTKVRLTGSGKDITIDKGVISIPRMSVNSTLGHLYITGVHNYNTELEYTFEVPFKLITRTAWGMLVNRSRREDAAEDQLQTPSKGAYVTLRLVGSEADGYEMKLGKENRKRKNRKRR